MPATGEHDDRKLLGPRPCEHRGQRHDVILLAVDHDRVGRHGRVADARDRGADEDHALRSEGRRNARLHERAKRKAGKRDGNLAVTSLRVRKCRQRIGGFAGKVLQKLGVVPQQLAGGDIYPALEKGTIDAAEWVGPYDDEKLGFNKVAPHYYYPGWWEGGPMLMGLVNLEKWNSLPKPYQSTIEQAGQAANNWMMARYDQANPAALKKLLAGGTKLHAFSPPIMQACLKATKELYAETSATNPNFKKVLDSMNNFTANGYQWWQVAELGYDSFMARNPQG